MQLGACFAGLAIENSMLGAAHGLANPLTAHYGIVHGQAVGLMLPHVIRFNAVGASAAAYRELLAATDWLSDRVPPSPDEGAEGLAEFVTRAGRRERDWPRDCRSAVSSSPCFPNWRPTRRDSGPPRSTRGRPTPSALLQLYQQAF